MHGGYSKESDIGEVQSEDGFTMRCKLRSRIEPRQYHFSTDRFFFFFGFNVKCLPFYEF